jgi:hypothetical protein
MSRSASNSRKEKKPPKRAELNNKNKMEGISVTEQAEVVVVVEERRKAVGAPVVIPKNMNLFEYLLNCQPPLDKKIIDIALAQCQVPRDLRDDAAQEVRLVWSTLKPDTKRFKPGQIASYAHRIASHAALRLRRELGSSVRLPGSAFRKRKDGSSYVTPGVLAAPLDWNELESWFDTADNADSPAFMPGADASTMPDIGEVSESDGEAQAVDTDEESRRQRLEALERNSNRLSRRQYKIMAHLIAGETFDDIQNKTGIKKGLVLREVSIAAAILGPDILGPIEST